MTGFLFSLRDRVTIKTADIGIIEGVISGAKMMVNNDNEYDVHFLQPDLSLAHIVVAEKSLTEMQPSKSELKVAVAIDETGLDSALGKARELSKIVGTVNRKTKAKTVKPAARKRR